MKLYIIGGRPCSGKTTVATKIGNQYDIPVMYLDNFAHEIVQKATKDTPELYKWNTVNMMDILQKDPIGLHKDYEQFYEELFPIFLDVIQKEDKEVMIIESAMMLPKFIQTLERYCDVKAVFLYTSDRFVRERYLKRDYAIEMMKTDKGQKALNNLLQRDVLFSDKLYSEVQLNGYHIIEVIKNDDFQAYNAVLKHFEFHQS